MPRGLDDIVLLSSQRQVVTRTGNDRINIDALKGRNIALILPIMCKNVRRDQTRLLVNQLDVGWVQAVTGREIYFHPYRGRGHQHLAIALKNEGFCDATLLQNGEAIAIRITARRNAQVLEFRRVE